MSEPSAVGTVTLTTYQYRDRVFHIFREASCVIDHEGQQVLRVHPDVGGTWWARCAYHNWASGRNMTDAVKNWMSKHL
jgi:hypothetical protein